MPSLNETILAAPSIEEVEKRSDNKTTAFGKEKGAGNDTDPYTWKKEKRSGNFTWIDAPSRRWE